MQVQATKKLTERATNLAFTAPSGTGKSLIIAGTALLWGGITVVFEPLLAVGADQTREMK
jgi:superfamily II DNA helicase RecQ